MCPGVFCVFMCLRSLVCVCVYSSMYDMFKYSLICLLYVCVVSFSAEIIILVANFSRSIS